MALSNSAKLLRAYMAATGEYEAKVISAALDIPIRTVQRLKLECATDGVCSEQRTNAKSATDGAATSAKHATGGVSTPAQAPQAAPRARVEDNNITTNLETTVSNHMIDLTVLSKRLLEAGGKALASPASRPNLLMVSAPLGWLNDGADLELDVLPAIRATAARATPGSITTWNYFAKPVAQAKTQRTASLPVAEPVRAPWAPPRQMTVSEMNAMLEAMGVSQ